MQRPLLQRKLQIIPILRRRDHVSALQFPNNAFYVIRGCQNID